MAEARDRLVRPVDLAAAFARRHWGPLGILVDNETERGSALSDSPRTQLRAPGVTLGRVTARARGGLGSGSSGTPRTAMARGRVLFGSPMTGRDSTLTVASARRGLGTRSPGGSVLPSWYPRTPLRDITAISTAIERRRSRLGGAQDQGSPLRQAQGPRALQPSGAPLEHETVTPSPAVRKNQCQSVARTFLLLNESTEFLTPEKKLLNQIETVKKEVMDELQKLKKTPIAKKAEREKKLRILRSMR